MSSAETAPTADSTAQTPAPVRIVVGAESVEERRSDEISSALKSYDLSRHRSRSVDSARLPIALLLTAALAGCVYFASRPTVPAVAAAFGEA